jgi:hypothetical protein
MIPKLEILGTKLGSKDLAVALDTWTSNSISGSSPRLKKKQLEAANLLSRVPGQSFPKLAYRVIFVDPRSLQSFKDFRAFIVDRKLPESFSSDMNGVKQFFTDGGGAAPTLKTRGLFLEVGLPSSEWMFNVSYLINKLTPQEIRWVETEFGNYPLTTYLRHKEVVARSGALLRALKQNSVKLVGYEKNRKFEPTKPAVLTASVLASLI